MCPVPSGRSTHPFVSEQQISPTKDLPVDDDPNNSQKLLAESRGQIVDSTYFDMRSLQAQATITSSVHETDAGFLNGLSPGPRHRFNSKQAFEDFPNSIGVIMGDDSAKDPNFRGEVSTNANTFGFGNKASFGDFIHFKKQLEVIPDENERSVMDSRVFESKTNIESPDKFRKRPDSDTHGGLAD